jgi:hypothetical protein
MSYINSQNTALKAQITNKLTQLSLENIPYLSHTLKNISETFIEISNDLINLIDLSDEELLSPIIHNEAVYQIYNNSRNNFKTTLNQFKNLNSKIISHAEKLLEEQNSSTTKDYQKSFENLYFSSFNCYNNADFIINFITNLDTYSKEEKKLYKKIEHNLNQLISYNANIPPLYSFKNEYQQQTEYDYIDPETGIINLPTNNIYNEEVEFKLAREIEKFANEHNLSDLLFINANLNGIQNRNLLSFLSQYENAEYVNEEKLKYLTIAKAARDLILSQETENINIYDLINYLDLLNQVFKKENDFENTNTYNPETLISAYYLSELADANMEKEDEYKIYTFLTTYMSADKSLINFLREKSASDNWNEEEKYNYISSILTNEKNKRERIKNYANHMDPILAAEINLFSELGINIEVRSIKQMFYDGPKRDVNKVYTPEKLSYLRKLNEKKIISFEDDPKDFYFTEDKDGNKYVNGKFKITTPFNNYIILKYRIEEVYHQGKWQFLPVVTEATSGKDLKTPIKSSAYLTEDTNMKIYYLNERYLTPNNNNSAAIAELINYKAIRSRQDIEKYKNSINGKVNKEEEFERKKRNALKKISPLINKLNSYKTIRQIFYLVLTGHLVIETIKNEKKETEYVMGTNNLFNIYADVVNLKEDFTPIESIENAIKNFPHFDLSTANNLTNAQFNQLLEYIQNITYNNFELPSLGINNVTKSDSDIQNASIDTNKITKDNELINNILKQYGIETPENIENKQEEIDISWYLKSNALSIADFADTKAPELEISDDNLKLLLFKYSGELIENNLITAEFLYNNFTQKDLFRDLFAFSPKKMSAMKKEIKDGKYDLLSKYLKTYNEFTFDSIRLVFNEENENEKQQLKEAIKKLFIINNHDTKEEKEIKLQRLENEIFTTNINVKPNHKLKKNLERKKTQVSDFKHHNEFIYNILKETGSILYKTNGGNGNGFTLPLFFSLTGTEHGFDAIGRETPDPLEKISGFDSITKPLKNKRQKQNLENLKNKDQQREIYEKISLDHQYVMHTIEKANRGELVFFNQGVKEEFQDIIDNQMPITEKQKQILSKQIIWCKTTNLEEYSNLDDEAKSKADLFTKLINAYLATVTSDYIQNQKFIHGYYRNNHPFAKSINYLINLYNNPHEQKAIDQFYKNLNEMILNTNEDQTNLLHQTLKIFSDEKVNPVKKKLMAIVIRQFVAGKFIINQDNRYYNLIKESSAFANKKVSKQDDELKPLYPIYDKVKHSVHLADENFKNKLIYKER